VQITVAESVDVEDRGAYYDESGVIRDMVQNHVLQLLTLVAMEPPSVADAESLRNKKIEVLQAIRGWHTEEASSYAVRGQYGGYRGTEGVKSTSNTPTYCAIRLFIDNWRWQGVPFYLRTGKALAEKDTEIVIEFHEPPHSMFELGPGQMLPPNLLGICLQPDEGTHLRFGVKVPDAGMTVQSVDMQFHYRSSFKDLPIPEAYELLLEDALQGDASLFIRADQIEGSWRVVEPLLHTWEDHEVTPLHIYPRGSWGPDAADRLLSQDGRVWRRACGDSAHDQHHESTE
jgi:glucose-6-phosphate 1-dehydrogenase